MKHILIFLTCFVISFCVISQKHDNQWIMGYWYNDTLGGVSINFTNNQPNINYFHIHIIKIKIINALNKEKQKKCIFV